ncbi:MAG: YciI family protein [Gaiellaceae bacterium]
MQFMLLIYDDEQTWRGMSEEERNGVMGEYFAYTEQLREAGAYVAGDALQPIDTATTVRMRDGEQLLTDGPFAETKEQLGGYYLVDVGSIDEALQWAAKIPSARYGSIEVRPVVVFDREEVGA